jgi:hypothetical protein
VDQYTQDSTDWGNTWRKINEWRKNKDQEIYRMIEGNTGERRIQAKDKKQTLNIRLIIGELPTIETLKIRRPDIQYGAKNFRIFYLFITQKLLHRN